MSISSLTVRRVLPLLLLLLILNLPLLALDTLKKTSAPSDKPSAFLELVRGPENAPVTIVEFEDFQCPFCASMVGVLNDLRAAYPDQVRILFKHSPLNIHPASPLAHEAALAAAEQGKFWEMHDLLFAHQKNWTRDSLVELARQLNLDLPTFELRLDSHFYKPAVDRDRAEAEGFGVTSTPTFFINGRKLSGVQPLESLKKLVDADLHPQSLASADDQPRVPNLHTENSPVRGHRGARVTIVEFSDTQCPFCQRSVSTLQEILALYPADVAWIFKHYPLSFHPDSLLAHHALVAADQQGQFWRMHDLIFANQNAIKRDDLFRYARQIGLDEARFAADLDDKKLAAIIDADSKEGEALGVQGTPTFFINGKKKVGAVSSRDLKLLVEAELGAPPLRQSSAASATVADCSKADLSKGLVGAPVEIQWFADLLSPLTPRAQTIIDQLMAAYPGQLHIVQKNFPLPTHPDSGLAHEAWLAASVQGKADAMQTFIFGNRQSLKLADLVAYARQLGFDQDAFQSTLEQHRCRPLIDHDLAEAQVRGVKGSPVFFINQQRIDGIPPLQNFSSIIEDALHSAVTKAQP